jgi:hypothetical protein
VLEVRSEGVLVSDRDAFRANRDAAKAKLHEKRLEAATYTAAEVKVLTETATRLGREIGRKEALDEVRGALIEEGATQRAIAIVMAIQAEDRNPLCRCRPGVVHLRSDHGDITKGDTP